MKIFSATQIRACDNYTIQAKKINSIDLMEIAAGQCVEWIKKKFPKDALFVVLCGSGNNGGDGFAIARMLHNSGISVKAFLLKISDDLSPDCKTNFLRLQRMDPELVAIVEKNTYITGLPENITLIDAIFGTGLSRPLSGWLASFIENINQFPNRKIAIDIPTGLMSDTVPDSNQTVLKVQDTLSFQFHKRTFLHPESATFAGCIHIIDIGLDTKFIAATESHLQTIDLEKVLKIYKPRDQNTHKGNYGHTLLIGGSYGKIGAILLSGKAAARAGAGLVTTYVPACGYDIIQNALPEAMCLTNGSTVLEKIEYWENFTAIGIGPGMGTDSKTVAALAYFLESCDKPIVIDADALNIISIHPELLPKIPKNSVITPHPKEFGRLFGENTNSMIQTDNARIQAMKYNLYIVLKNHNTVVINPDGNCWYNTTGNAGMATGGSGDVLTGIITGLMAQGYNSFDASLLGVYLHGLSGDIAANEISQEAMISSDIINFLSKSFLSLKNKLPTLRVLFR